MKVNEEMMTPAVEEPTEVVYDEPVQYTPKVGKEQIREAMDTLERYKSCKAPLDDRIIKEEEWYKLQHSSYIYEKDTTDIESGYVAQKPTSAWLFQAIDSKHADAMDNYPQPDALPRSADDKESAEILSKVLPTVLERADFEKVYDLNWWEKLKHGCGIYGVFWDKSKENGLGDISVRRVDALNIFWESEVEDIQESKNVFLVNAIDIDDVEAMFPQTKNKLHGNLDSVKKYFHSAGEMQEDTMKDKVLMVDWYYKTIEGEGEEAQTVLHFCKFIDGYDEPLYADENEEMLQGRGWYDHGKYPFVFDTMYPEKDTPYGFGVISVAMPAQMCIDKLDNDLLINADWCSKPRYMVSDDAGINEEDLLDTTKTFVHVTGSLNDTKIRRIEVPHMDGNALNLRAEKINELKETTSNRDVNNGGGGSATAAAAISAMQEAGNKISRSLITASYRCYREICYMCIDLMRQFYNEQRTFRIIGNDGSYSFQTIGANELAPKLMEEAYAGQWQVEEPVFHEPVFDVVIKAEKRNPYSQLTQMEYAKQFYQLGFFNPEMAQQAMGALQMMEFEGKEDVTRYVQEGDTLIKQLQQAMQLLQMYSGIPMNGDPNQMAMNAAGGMPTGGTGLGGGLGRAAINANAYNKTPYQQRLEERARPDANRTNNGTSVTAK